METKEIWLTVSLYVVFHILLHYFLDAINNYWYSIEFVQELNHLSFKDDGKLMCDKNEFKQLCIKYGVTEFPCFRTVYVHYIPDVNDNDDLSPIKRRLRKFIHIQMLALQTIFLLTSVFLVSDVLFLLNAWLWASVCCVLLALVGILRVEKELGIYTVTNKINFTRN